MGIFTQLGKQNTKQAAQAPQQMDPRQMQQAFQNDLASIKSDPVAYAKAHGKNIPDGMKDASQITQYLLRSGQITNPRYQMALRLLGGMNGR